MDRKKLGMIAGAAAGLFLLGFIIGYAAFSGGARIRVTAPPPPPALARCASPA